MERAEDRLESERRERSSAIEVAEATPEDAEAIAAVRRESWLATYPNEQLGITRDQVAATDFDSASALEAATDWLRQEDPGQRVWVAKSEEAVVGFCSVVRGGDAHRLGAMYVSPESQEMGVGHRLLDAALTWLGDEAPVRLEVASYNDDAIRFYERHGFRRTGRAATSNAAALPDGTRIPEIEMIRPAKSKD